MEEAVSSFISSNTNPNTDYTYHNHCYRSVAHYVNESLVIDETLLTADMLNQVPALPVQQAGNAVQRHLIETVFN